MKKLLTTLFALICLNGFANPQPRPEYPRPQFERSQWVNLNGTWNFEFDFGESGKDRSLQKAEQLSQQITVPFCPESKLSGVAYTDLSTVCGINANCQSLPTGAGKRYCLTLER